MEKTSYIKGFGHVKFGGAIQLCFGVSKKTNNPVIGFSELPNQHEAGADITDDEIAQIKYKGQIVFEFDDVRSIDIVRRALDKVESYLKEKKEDVELFNKE
jgi:hypothetical protein